MYVKMDSWHIVLTPTRVPSRYVTLCGRRAVGTTVNELPMNEKSCESCLRLDAQRREDDPDVVDEVPVV